MKLTKKQRSLAAKKGWQKRRQKQRQSPLAALASVATFQPSNVHREFLVVISYKKKRRGFRADLYIVADFSATPTELADQARRQLPEGKSFLANWIEGSYAEIVKGQPTGAPKQTRIRSFQRYKQ
jgi:hypothetical protein